jgi:AraC-like DNA-binding protein
VLLRSTDDKVLSIALDCGFRDLAHFNRTFKRALAQPPTAFRRQAPR